MLKCSILVILLVFFINGISGASMQLNESDSTIGEEALKGFNISHIDLKNVTIDKNNQTSKLSTTPKNFRPATNYETVNTNGLFDFIRYQYPLPNGATEPNGEYDFIIIGGGSAGCVIASRLSENRKWSVLLLEAGGTESIITDVPILATHLLHTDYTWDYRMERQDKMCQAMENQQCALFRGKALGGTSVINLMMHTRGNKRDWDEIAADGNSGWSYDEVLPYFLKSERSKLKVNDNSSLFNRNGLLAVDDVLFRTTGALLFFEASQELGNNITDHNGENQLGVSYTRANLLNGRRHSAAKAFLYPFRNRPNLHILPRSTVTKINIDPQTKTVKSVDFIRNKSNYNVNVIKEVVLSAGTFVSPKLLILSGIGPKDHLQDLGIEVIQDLPVGENLHDHITYPGLFFKTENKRNYSLPQFNTDSMIQFITSGNGSLSMAGLESSVYIQTETPENNTTYPDLMIGFTPFGIFADEFGVARKAFKISEKFYNSTYKNITGKAGFSLQPMVLYSQSKGRLILKDKNPFHWPRISFDLVDEDKEKIIEGIKYAIRLSKTKAFSELNAELHDTPVSTCGNFEFASDEYWNCAVKFLIVPGQHHMGTCKMGPANDFQAVVDSELKVYGINKLRVADLSIIPRQISAHTNAPAIMIGEKVSDILMKTWLKKKTKN